LVLETILFALVQEEKRRSGVSAVEKKKIPQEAIAP
jgi:hypothetical protein